MMAVISLPVRSGGEGVGSCNKRDGSTIEKSYSYYLFLNCKISHSALTLFSKTLNRLSCIRNDVSDDLSLF